MQLNGPRAVVFASLIALAGIILGAFLNPLGEKWVNTPKTAQSASTRKLEEIPQQIFAYAGNNNPDGGWSAFWLYYDTPGIPIYKLEYYLPEDKNGYAGLAFEFMQGENLSAYRAVECTLIFSQPSDVIDLYFKDIAEHFNAVRVANNNSNEMSLRYEFSNYPDVNFNAVQEFGLVVSTDFTDGSHQVRIKEVKFVK